MLSRLFCAISPAAIRLLASADIKKTEPPKAQQTTGFRAALFYYEVSDKTRQRRVLSDFIFLHQRQTGQELLISISFPLPESLSLPPVHALLLQLLPSESDLLPLRHP